MKICPKCHKEIKGYPAISRLDEKIELCARCGNVEALELIGMPQDEIDKIMTKIDNLEKEVVKTNG